MATEGDQNQKPLQIYPTSTTEISPFWKDKYERDAKKYWDLFYKRHQDKFFKDRHYLDKEWGSYFQGPERKVVLEVGCGVGNTVFPLIATYPDIFVHACDFSARAVELVKSHKDFREDQVNAFVCDLTADDLSKEVAPSSVDIVTMVFVLSAVAPEKMPLVLRNVRKVLKPNGVLLLRDYAIGDLAQERFTCKDQKISDNFYVRGDGTRAFYFSEDFLTNLSKDTGFKAEELHFCCKQVANRSRELVMNRRWIQAVFCFSDELPCTTKCANKVDFVNLDKSRDKNANGLKDAENNVEVDMSESIAMEMFGTLPSIDEIIEVNLGECNFRVKGLPKDYQHTCKSTGLMLWESARLMSEVLFGNPSIVAGKRVLELGCGCTGVCSMVAARCADIVVATDGDTKALDLLKQNVDSNLEQTALSKLVTKRLEWGNRDHIKSIKQISPSGFEVIIGTDVTYVQEALSPLFETARELISTGTEGTSKSALILCYMLRRADEKSILSAASQNGFTLVDRWPVETLTNTSQSIISSWLPNHTYQRHLQNTPLNILYFET